MQIKVTAITKTRTETLLAKREEVTQMLAEMKEVLEKINNELYDRVAPLPEQKMQIDEHTIQIVKRVSFTHVPLDYAEKVSATKIVVDSTVLKPLYNKGIEIPNVEISEYVMVK